MAYITNEYVAGFYAYDYPVATSTTYTANPVWQNWVGTSSNTVATFTQSTTAWTQWNTQWVPYNQDYNRRLTPQELEALEAERIRIEEASRLRIQEEETRRREYQETEERAKACLLRHITTEQQEQFDKDRSFILKTDKRTYRIYLDRMVEELDAEGRRIAEYCIYTREGVPAHDNMLNKVLLLKCDEAEFHKIAHAHRFNPAIAA